jgi:hypothetical protein
MLVQYLVQHFTITSHHRSLLTTGFLFSMIQIRWLAIQDDALNSNVVQAQDMKVILMACKMQQSSSPGGGQYHHRLSLLLRVCLKQGEGHGPLIKAAYSMDA